MKSGSDLTRVPTQYIDLTQLSEFVDSLEEPLRLPAPNLFKLVSFDIPICDDDKIHCVDILDALTKNFLGTVDTGGDLGEIQKGPERKNYHPISSMLKRQREVFVVRVIQRTWRNYVKRKHGITDEEVEKTDDKTETIITIDDPDKEVEKLSEKPEENLSPSAGDDFKTVELFAEKWSRRVTDHPQIIQISCLCTSSAN